MWSCTCHSPATIDLTEAILCSSSSNSNDKMTALLKEQLALVESLSTRGWCIISIDLRRLEHDSPIQSIQPLKMKQQVRHLFSPGLVASSTINATFRGRTAESGSAGTAKSEPKQSWEVRRCCSSDNETCTPLSMAQDWTRALHSVAVAVTRVLNIPSNVLLHHNDCSCSTAGVANDPCNMDLLRIFFYDAVNDNDEESLGSSPHTDWGSWTVVWQDDVGGLQTYCHVHEQWVDVPAAPLEEDRVYFVVHVGDVTSLAMGHAAIKQQEDSSDDDAPTVVWPSPRHRVLSPSGTTPRASLVYFAYPPPRISLKDMEEALVEYAKDNKMSSPAVVPYDEYFVLQNQSTKGSTRSPKETYEVIQSRALDEVFAEKWQQVQR